MGIITLIVALPCVIACKQSESMLSDSSHLAVKQVKLPAGLSGVSNSDWSKWQLKLSGLKTQTGREDVNFHVFIKKPTDKLDVSQLVLNSRRHIGSVTFYGQRPGEPINSVMAIAPALRTIDWKVGDPIDVVIMASSGDQDSGPAAPVISNVELVLEPD